jgi:hypothetical protein
MVLTATGKFRKERKSNTGVIFIPADIVVDSAFPLKEGRVRVEIRGKELVIRQLEA